MILKQWKDIVEGFDDNSKCDMCWKFYAPLTEIDLNLIRSEDDANCCVHVFLIRNKAQDFSSNVNYTNNLGVPSVSQNEMYDVYFLIKSRVGINNYNEKPNHPISESRQKTIFEPLRSCIDIDILLKICEINQVTNWSGQYIYDYQDEMYFGIKLSVTQKIENYELKR